jgi:nucleoside-diphosphate-sugar epimerase
MWHDTVLVEGSQSEEFLKHGSCFIDVRNLAEAHVKSLEIEEAGGERIIVSAGKYIAYYRLYFFTFTAFRTVRVE